MTDQDPEDTYCVTTAADEVTRNAPAHSRNLDDAEARAVCKKYANRIHYLMTPCGGDMPGGEAFHHSWQLAEAYLAGGETAVEAMYQSIVESHRYTRDRDAGDDIWGDAPPTVFQQMRQQRPQPQNC